MAEDVIPAVYYLDEQGAPVAGTPVVPYETGNQYAEGMSMGTSGGDYLDVPLYEATTGPSQGLQVGDYSDYHGVVGAISNLEVSDLVQMFIVYSFIIAGALTAVFIFIGGISFILSGGDDAKIKQAVNTIRYAIVGLIVTILSFTCVTIIGRIFGLNLLDYISYTKIKDAINRVVSDDDPGQRLRIIETTPPPPPPIFQQAPTAPPTGQKTPSTPGSPLPSPGTNQESGTPTAFPNTTPTPPASGDDRVIPAVEPLPQ